MVVNDYKFFRIYFKIFLTGIFKVAHASVSKASMLTIHQEKKTAVPSETDSISAKV